MAEHSFPTEMVDLPSKGWFYDSDNPLSSGQIELKYMTAKEEDILTSRALLQKGVAIDRLISSLVVDKSIEPESLLIGDKNAILIQARINAYGQKYKSQITCPACGEKSNYGFDLTEVQYVETTLSEGVQRLPNNNLLIKLSNGWEVECKMLNGKDETKLTQLMQKKRKKKQPESPLTDMLNAIIVSVSGHTEREVIQKAVAFMPAKDTRFLREAYQAAVPNVDMSLSFDCPSCEYEQDMEVPLSAEFFWPKQ